MPSESGTVGRGGGAPADGAVVDVVLLLEPVRPAITLEAIGADRTSDIPTEALVAPPLVSHGFGGDGADMPGNLLPQNTVAQWRDVTMRCAAGIVEGGWRADVKGWEMRLRPVEASLRGSPGCAVVAGVLRQDTWIRVRAAERNQVVSRRECKA